ncbi:hypothetical protein ACFFJN_08625 [Erwinia mallotivora]|uniref:hypothetical protein n=1 Tax=Erwinia mallotivora TaxID=69222 RepID=UPI0035F085B9
MQALLYGIILYLSLSLSPGPRTQSLLRKSDKNVLLKQNLADVVFSLTLLCFAAVWRFWMSDSQLIVVTIVFYILFAASVFFSPLKRLTTVSAVKTPFASSLANYGIWFDVVLPCAITLACLVDVDSDLLLSSAGYFMAAVSFNSGLFYFSHRINYAFWSACRLLMLVLLLMITLLLLISLSHRFG